MSATPDLGERPVVGDLGVDRLPTVGLTQLQEVADLQRRFDHKYVVATLDLPELIVSLGEDVCALEVDGRPSTSYSSVYFDTRDLRTYRDHLKRRRRRYKVRTRHYGDTATTMLEVKCKGPRGSTVKYRWPHPGQSPNELGAEGERLVAQALDEQYGFPLPGELRPVAITTFERLTLVDLAAIERVTIDLGLTVQANDRVVSLGEHYAVVEVKAADRRNNAVRALATLGLRPDRVSKYCVGIAAAHDEVRGNPWIPVLRRLQTV